MPTANPEFVPTAIGPPGGGGGGGAADDDDESRLPFFQHLLGEVPEPAAAPGRLLDIQQRATLRTAKAAKKDANLLQGLDIDESLGLDQVDEQIRDYLSKKGVRVIELFRQWDDDETGQIEKKEFRRWMKELGLTVGKKQLDELFDMWDPDKTGAQPAPRSRRDFAPRWR